MKLIPVADLPVEKDIIDVPFDTIKIFKICKSLERLCIESNGAGLSAIQVGLPYRLFIVRTSHNKFRYFANCDYSPNGVEQYDSIEGCLTLPNEVYRVRRFRSVRVVGFEIVADKKDVNFKPLDMTTSDVVFQHEIDHHKPLLISDVGKKVTLSRLNFGEK